MKAPDPVAFTIFNIDIRWYGLLICFAVALAIFLICKRAPKHNFTNENILDVAVFALPAAIIGVRLYFVLFNLDYYSLHPEEIINYREGGLAIHGGIIAFAIACYFVCRYKKLKFLDMADLILPFLALAQAIGRWGNFFNEEAHGGPTNLPWGIIIDGEKVHPTFLYESIWCLLLFIFLIIMDNRRTFFGQTMCLYAILYSVERFFVEWLRTDSLMIGPFKQAQVLSLALIIGATILLFYLRKHQRIDYEEYMKAGPKLEKDITKAVKKP